jgi:hypothetical protein
LFQLLQPSWLYALAGISIPVIIHLWNQRPGRILKVGSTSLVPEEAKEYKRSLQLSDLLLLLLRCLLIAVLAIVLANPNWKKPFTASRQKGWILISRQNLKETYAHFKPQVDSLYKDGLEFHYFNEGFAKEKLEDALVKPADTTAGILSYWKLSELLDLSIPASIPVYIFTDNYLKHFSGSRPTLSFRPNWLSYTPPASPVPAATINTDTTTLNISIFTDKYANDARYIKAAIDAIQSFSKRNIKTSIVNKNEQVTVKQDWLFWLSDAPVNENINAANIFSYSPGKPQTISSVINTDETTSLSVSLYKSITPNDSLNNNTENIWKDGFGNSILSYTNSNNRKFYTLYTHFDPSWNELVWNSDFPAVMYNLLLRRNTGVASAPGYQLIDQKQLMPAYSLAGVQKGKAVSLESVDISGIFWLVVILLFIAERLVSFYNTKLKTNG